MVVSFDATTTISTVSDSKSNTWTILGSVSTTGGAKLAVYTSFNWTGGGSHTGTVTFSGNAFPVLHMFEVTGAATSSPVDIDITEAEVNQPFSVTSGTLAQNNELIVIIGEQNVAGIATDAYTSSTSTILSQEPDLGNFWTSGIATSIVATNASQAWAITKGTSTTGAVGTARLITFKEATAGTTPAITSTSSATPSNGSSLTITGTDFQASQGAGYVTIGGVVQTVTSWADTSITVTVARGTNKYGVSVNVVVTDNAAASSSPYALTSLQPQSGWSFVDMSTPNTSVGNRISTTPDLVSGDQIAYDNVGGKVSVANDATFSAGTSVRSFDFEVWSSPDGWGFAATQYLYNQPLTNQGLYSSRGVAEAERRSLGFFSLDPKNWSTTPQDVAKWFAPELTAASGGPPTHPSTGALAAQASTVAGSATHLLLHTTTGALSAQAATITGSAAHQHAATGALTAQAATVAGTAVHNLLHTSSGALTAQDATIAGAALHPHTSTGALTAQDAAIAGAALHPHTSTGALAAQAATVAGDALHPHTSTGALAAQDSAVAGAADHVIPGSTHSTSGALAAQDATVDGTATRLALHTTTGALTAQDATVNGAAAHQHAATGALAASAAAVDGTAAHLVLHTSTGALAADAAAVSGAAAHEHAATGALSAQAAAVDGSAGHAAAGVHIASGALAAGDATLSGAAEYIGTGENVLSPKFLGSPNVVIRGAKAEGKASDATPLPAQITNVPDAPPPVKLSPSVMDMLGFAPPITPLPVEVPEVPELKVKAKPRKEPPAAPAPEVAPPPPPAPPPAPVDPVKAVEVRLDALNSQLETALSEVAALRAKLEAQASAQVQVKTAVERVAVDTAAIARREQNRQRAEEITRRLLKDLAEED